MAVIASGRTEPGWPPAPGRATVAGREARPIVLVIDADAMRRETLVQDLEERFEIRTAGGGSSGLRRALTGPVDAVLVDLAAPPMPMA